MSLNQRKDDRSAIAYEILNYLTKYLDAQDTLEGIMRWWLLEQEIERWAVDVQAALDELVAKELILEYRGKDKRIHYRINHQKAKEVRALIKKRF